MSRWRLSVKFRNRDWWGIAIDLVIVVLGVFLGIQVSNWNEARQDRTAGRAYLERIRDDLRSDVRSLDEHERYWRETEEAGGRALRYAEQGAPIDDWALVNDFFGASQRWTYSINDATYRELLSAGDVGLLPDTALRKQLADYYVSQADRTVFLTDHQSEYRHLIRTVIPHDLQQYLIHRCQGAVVKVFVNSCPRPVTSTDLAGLNRRIAGNEVLIGELRAWMTTVSYLRLIARDQRALAAELAVKVDRALS